MSINPYPKQTKNLQAPFIYAAVPAVAECHIENLSRVTEAIQKTLNGYSFELHIAAPDMLGEAGMVISFNQTIDEFLASNADYLFWVEADNIIPPNTVETLLSHDVDVAAGVSPYHNIAPVYKYLVVAGYFESLESYRTYNLTRQEIEGKTLTGNIYAGTSCLLIKRRVFINGLRFTSSNTDAGLDMLFWKQLTKQGFKTVIDGNVICRDIG